MGGRGEKRIICKSGEGSVVYYFCDDQRKEDKEGDDNGEELRSCKKVAVRNSTLLRGKVAGREIGGKG